MIAILGATSQIAKGLIDRFRADGETLHLFNRDNYYIFHEGKYDTVINCVGVRTNLSDYSEYLIVNNEYDNMAVDYVKYHPEALMISFSSGAVYSEYPATEWSKKYIDVNNMTKKDFYGIFRIYAEAKHRSLENINIADLRVFSYLSMYADINDNYFISDVLRAVRDKTILKTSDQEMTRDYLHPDDLYQAVKRCREIKKINKAIDINSAKPATKREILNYFQKEYGLQYETERFETSPTGNKALYYSARANDIGYKPRYSSMETIMSESKLILDNQ